MTGVVGIAMKMMEMDVTAVEIAMIVIEKAVTVMEMTL